MNGDSTALPYDDSDDLNKIAFLTALKKPGLKDRVQKLPLYKKLNTYHFAVLVHYAQTPEMLIDLLDNQQLLSLSIDALTVLGKTAVSEMLKNKTLTLDQLSHVHSPYVAQLFDHESFIGSWLSYAAVWLTCFPYVRSDHAVACLAHPIGRRLLIQKKMQPVQLGQLVHADQVALLTRGSLVKYLVSDEFQAIQICKVIRDILRLDIRQLQILWKQKDPLQYMRQLAQSNQISSVGLFAHKVAPPMTGVAIAKPGPLSCVLL